ncbi:Serpentine Receptor, class H [Caenorhabditis elegans]|uniref:Serpentine Receptor, class H n=1 Tax=Caenorhabditis elegans TaxID=6239 RepID=Q7YXA9_CAEEL|nr:Serpentine Receptor, class H [Caenorhabditis elegans]CAE11307.1 Serpentine Receptor, class H [Caenorhabditis elegans]|eukprot:NP_001023404.1 Serpentine Receptor, class H [Caenorhabditis elegans]
MSLSEYFETIYPSKCSPDSRYLATVKGMKTVGFSISSISLPVLIFTSYCIMRKTPESMKSVKMGLLNLNSWYIVSQVIQAIFIFPIVYFPFSAFTIIGLAEYLNIPTLIQLILSITITNAMLVSIIVLFENRSSSISFNKFCISRQKYKNFWIFSNCGSSFLVLTPPFFFLPDQEEAKIRILKTLSCPIKEFFTDQTIVKVFGKFWETYFVQASQLIYLISIVQIVFFSTCCVYYLIIFKYSNVSVTTRRLQFRVFIGVVIQSLLPVVLTHIPLMIIMGSNERKEYDQMNNNLYILSAIIHNGVASLSILLVHGSYRKFLISFFWKEKSKVIQITHCSKTINL